MRELKFRAWDSFNRLMWGADKCYEDNLATFFKEFERAKVGENNPILMQFTGLLDKNGKEIYEGDIVKVADDYELYGQFAGEIREIFFNNGGFRLKPKWDKKANGNYLEDDIQVEVIGNIYENPELLEAK